MATSPRDPRAPPSSVGATGPTGPKGAPGSGTIGATGPAGPAGPAGSGIPEAPSDGQIYGRKNAAWVVISGTAPPEPPLPSDVVDARQFSPTPHAGTEADPWPGQAIADAFASLPSAGATVWLADGVWNVSTALRINNPIWTLTGQSLNAKIVFTTLYGRLWFGDQVNPITCTISNLTLDASKLDFKADSGLRVSNAQNSFFKNNYVIAHANGGQPPLFYEGGSNNEFSGNTIIDGSGTGGDGFQLQALGGTPNSGFVVKQNEFDSVGVWLIGINDLQFINNTIHNKKLGNAVGVLACGDFGHTIHNVKIDGNTVDATLGGGNQASISGLPNDPGGKSIIDGFIMSNNILKGACKIAVQSPDPANYSGDLLAGNEKSHITIAGNALNGPGDNTIDIRGGGGIVDTILVENNIVQGPNKNSLLQDAHTTNATIRNNTGL
jgi:parallel beta helix pectate lyase-like protein